MNIEDFLKHVLITEIKGIQDNHYHYLSFGLIAQGIELLGACLDDKPISQQGLSKIRFTTAIAQLFPTAYHPHAVDLYSKLRCGLLHTFFPGQGIELIEDKDVAKFGTHLTSRKIRTTDTNESLIVVSERFHEDLKNAVEKLINENRIHATKRTLGIAHYENLISLI